MLRDKKILYLTALVMLVSLGQSIQVDSYTTNISRLDFDSDGFEEPYLVVNYTFSDVDASSDSANFIVEDQLTGERIAKNDRFIGSSRRFDSAPDVLLTNGTTYSVRLEAIDDSAGTTAVKEFEYTYTLAKDPYVDSTNSSTNTTNSTGFIEGLLKPIGDNTPNVGKGINNKVDSGVAKLQGAIDGVVSSIKNAIESLKGLLYSLITALVNAISVIAGWVLNAYNIITYQINNHNLIAQGEFWDSNETFTYYNYTDDYPTRINETDAETLDIILNRYDIETQYSAKEYLDDANVTLTDDPDPVYVLGTVNNKTYTINSYTHETNYFPQGIGGAKLTINRVVSLLSIILYGILNILPSGFVNFVSLFVDQAFTIGKIIDMIVTYVFGAIDFAFNDGTLIIIGAIKAYIGFVAMFYGSIVGRVLEGKIGLGKASRLVVRDVETKIEMYSDSLIWTWNFIESGFNTIIRLLRFVRSLIPFL